MAKRFITPLNSTTIGINIMDELAIARQLKEVKEMIEAIDRRLSLLELKVTDHQANIDGFTDEVETLWKEVV